MTSIATSLTRYRFFCPKCEVTYAALYRERECWCCGGLEVTQLS